MKCFNTTEHLTLAPNVKKDKLTPEMKNNIKSIIQDVLKINQLYQVPLVKEVQKVHKVKKDQRVVHL